MEAGIIVYILIAVLCSALCFVFGMIVGKRRKNVKESKGILNVDCSDPANGTYMYLELSVPITEVADQKQVTFNVHIIR